MATKGVVLQQPGKWGGEQEQPPQSYGMAVTAQPSNFSEVGNMPGLEYLESLNRIDVHQVLHLVEVLVGFEKNNEYKICNEASQQFMHAKEDTDCMSRQFCGNIRPLNIVMRDMQGRDVFQVERPLRCGGCCCCCCLQYLDINYPLGNRIARVKEIWTCMVPKYEIEDISGNVLLRIEGDCCYCKCCADVGFRITRPDGSDAGQIIKHWGGCRELLGQVNDFSIEFAPGETVLNKAILLGATFLVDFMYFEANNN